MPEGMQPTPEEWVEFFLKSTPENQVRAAEIVLRNSATAHKCFMQDHDPERSYRQGWQDALKTLTTELDKDK